MALSQTHIVARLSPYYPGEGGRALIESITNAHADLQTLNTWANTLVAKLNADVGVTDTNYVGPGLTTQGI